MRLSVVIAPSHTALYMVPENKLFDKINKRGVMTQATVNLKIQNQVCNVTLYIDFNKVTAFLKRARLLFRHSKCFHRSVHSD